MKIAEIELKYYVPAHDTGSYVKVFIRIKDSVTGQLVNGDGINVRYRQNINGITTDLEKLMLGNRAQVYDGKGRDANFSTSWTILSQGEPEPVPPQLYICSLGIAYVNIDKPESAPVANDARITVSASSEFAIEYSADNGLTWQASPVFNGLAGGYRVIRARDDNPLNCTAQSEVTIPTTQSLLVADPSVDMGNDNISRWSAAFNPVVFTYQRKDFSVTQIVTANFEGKGPYAKLFINTDVSALAAEQRVYVNAGAYKGVFKVLASSGNSLIIDTPFAGNHNGFININSLRPYYRVKTRISFCNPETNAYETIVAVNRPDATGIVRADISNFLQSLLQVTDTSDYTRVNYRDSNLSASYRVAYAEDWDRGVENQPEPQYIAIDKPFYVLYAAKQLGEPYGGNLAAYVPFKNGTPAKWITDFAEPAYSNGYPFDIGFIYSEHLAGLQLYYQFTLLDINRQPLPGGAQNTYLLNEDGSWLLNQDGSKMLISRQTSGSNNLTPGCLGLNRLLINYAFPAEAYYVNIAIKYNDADGVARTVTKTQTIRIDKAADDTWVYLRWIGLTGAWNYYRFVYNQEVTLDVQNAVIIKNHVSNWQHQQGIEEVISKTAGQKIKVMAEDLPVADIRGLQSIKYSPKVQMLVSKNPVKWQTIVVNTATYSEYETRNGQAPFSIMFNLPAINVQRQ